MEWEERKKNKRCREKLSHHAWLPSSAFAFIFFSLNIKMNFFKRIWEVDTSSFFDTYQQVLEQGLRERKGTKRDMLVETYFKLL